MCKDPELCQNSAILVINSNHTVKQLFAQWKGRIFFSFAEHFILLPKAPRPLRDDKDTTRLRILQDISVQTVYAHYFPHIFFL